MQGAFIFAVLPWTTKFRTRLHNRKTFGNCLMEAKAYEELSEQEDSGWYYTVRREIILWCLKNYTEIFTTPKNTPLEILDIGCGTGGSSLFFAQYANVTGIDISKEAIEHASRKLSLAKKQSPTNFPHNCTFIHTSIDDFLLNHTKKYDLILILGVLYHRNITSPEEILKKITSLLNENGLLVWNEAAHKELWRAHDIFVHGKRRFSPDEMKNLILKLNLSPILDFPFLCWGYPIAWLEARTKKLPYGESDPKENSSKIPQIKSSPNENTLSWLDIFFKNLEFLVWHLCRLLNFPFKGVSHTIVAKKSS